MGNDIRNAGEDLYDVVIIGGGPAGLTAAVYLARARYRVMVLEKEKFGGQITITSEVVNYPGVYRTSGAELTETMRRQAEGFGAEFLLAEAIWLELDQDVKRVHTGRGTLECFGVLLATGAHPRMVGFPGEAEYRGRGVAYCATCDGEFFTGKEVFVVGGGFAAAEEGVFLTKYARHVTILVREEDFTCAKATADAARENEKITVLTNTEVVEVSGDSLLRRIVYVNRKTGEQAVYQAEEGDTFGVFVFVGYAPATELVKGAAALDAQGYVVTDREQQTSVPGLYAAGDVCIKNLRQVVTAVGEGALAATELEKYAAKMQKKTGLRPRQPQVRPQTAKMQEEGGRGVFSQDILAQLDSVFQKMEQPLLLKLYLDERPVSAELRGYMEEMEALTDKISVEVESDPQVEPDRPCVRILRRDGTDTGLAFHGVPGGHEFTSFVLGLYNVSGPGQPLDAALRQQIKRISHPVDMRIMVSLSCTLCPELVASAWRIAAESPYVRAEVYDLGHFPEWKERYQIMSVPCCIIDDHAPSFGKKSTEQLMELIH